MSCDLSAWKTYLDALSDRMDRRHGTYMQAHENAAWDQEAAVVEDPEAFAKGDIVLPLSPSNQWNYVLVKTGPTLCEEPFTFWAASWADAQATQKVVTMLQEVFP